MKLEAEVTAEGSDDEEQHTPSATVKETEPRSSEVRPVPGCNGAR